MTRVCLSDNRSCFGHGVSNYTTSSGVSARAFYRIGWGELSPLFAEEALLGGLKAQVEEA